MLTPSEQLHNTMLDLEISINEREHNMEKEILDMRRKVFISQNPDFPNPERLFVQVTSKRQVIGIRYVE